MQTHFPTAGFSAPRRAAPWFLVAGLLLIAGTAVGCGESDADKAQTQVCDARADMQTEIDELAGLAPATATVDGVKENLNAIEDDLKQIKDAQGHLNKERFRRLPGRTRVISRLSANYLQRA